MIRRERKARPGGSWRAYGWARRRRWKIRNLIRNEWQGAASTLQLQVAFFWEVQASTGTA